MLMRLKPTNSPQMPPKLPENRKKCTSEGLKTAAAIHAHKWTNFKHLINTSNAELNPICHLLALLGSHHILHVGRVRVNRIISCASYNIVSAFKTSLSDDFNDITPSVATDSFQFLVNYRLVPQA